MKNLNFTCPHCGGHKLIVEQPLQWIRLDIIGFDDDGDLLLDYDHPSIVDNDNDDYDIYCENCYVPFVAIDINRLEPVNKNKRGQNDNNPNETTD